MHVAVTGSTGLIGTALVSSLRDDGHRVTRLVRREPTAVDEVGWGPASGSLDPASLAGVDAVVHLAGEPIASRPWTKTQKQRIRDSRVQGTRLLADTLARMETPPSTLVASSGVNYYGDGGAQVLTEEHGPGDDFLAEVCQAWEGATGPASAAGVRVVNCRTGIVLSDAGGVLQIQLPLFKLGLGGKLGSGEQYMSWISRDDLVGVFRHALEDETLAGPVNAVAPNPITNATFTETLGDALGRPTVLRVPHFAPKMVLGKMADALLFASLRAVPARMEAAGYDFTDPQLEPALEAMVSPSPS
jgi:uncharacterized protein (TIGR01777 family)